MALTATKKTDSYISQLEDMKIHVDEMLEKKQAIFDSKSERWQESDKGDELQTEITNLEELAEAIENTIDKFNEVFEMA